MGAENTGDRQVANNAVQIEKVKMWGAILIAVVGAVSSLITVAVTKYFDSGAGISKEACEAQVREGATKAVEAMPKQRWIKILRIEGPEGKAARIVIEANNIAYSYPPRHAWAEVGPQITPAIYPLPLEQEHRIHFSAEVLDDGADVDYGSQEVVVFANVTSAIQTYRLNAIIRSDAGSMRSAGSVKLNHPGPLANITVFYEIIQ